MPATPKRQRGQPHKVLHLTSYDRLEAYLSAFAQGHFHLLILVGSGGLAKSRSVREVLNGKACWIEGNATPFGMYAKLYRHRDGSGTGQALNLEILENLGGLSTFTIILAFPD